MTTGAFKEGWGMRISDGQPSPTFNELEQILEPPTIGTTADLIETTNHQSNGYKEFIGGLKDGDEFTVQCNRVQTATVQNQVRTAAKNAANVDAEVYINDGTTLETFTVTLTVLSAQLLPGTSEQNKMGFGFKISGEIGGDW